MTEDEVEPLTEVTDAEAVVALVALGEALEWQDTTAETMVLVSTSSVGSVGGSCGSGRSGSVGGSCYTVSPCRTGCSGWRTSLEYDSAPKTSLAPVVRETDLGPVLPTFETAKGACQYHYATGKWDWDSMPAVSFTDDGLEMLVRALSKYEEEAIGDVDTIYNQLSFGDTTGRDVNALEQTFGERDKHADDVTALLRALQSEARRRSHCTTPPANGSASS